MNMYNVQIKVNMQKITSNVPDLSAAILILLKQFLLIQWQKLETVFRLTGDFIFMLLVLVHLHQITTTRMRRTTEPAMAMMP